MISRSRNVTGRTQDLPYFRLLTLLASKGERCRFCRVSARRAKVSRYFATASLLALYSVPSSLTMAVSGSVMTLP